ncbi:MAG: filamentous hemagglutinin N-terminal protein, partial [Proteobacteria bacterium]|nr:filamentous hemagglutinin N-terminal protein [Pseudomonadota bacterium]
MQRPYGDGRNRSQPARWAASAASFLTSPALEENAINHIYRLVWNAARQQYAVGPESARSGRRGGGSSRSIKPLLAALLLVFSEAIGALPVDGVVAGGSGAISVASTLDLSVADFMNGKRTFSGSGGRIDNLGSLTASDGGYIALLGGQVSNQGTIAAQLGTVALAAGNRVGLDFAGDKLLSLQVEQGALDALVENGQLIKADGGSVILTTRAAGEVLSGVVNNTGIVQARGISSDNGVIRLSGDLVVNTGTLDASGSTGSNGGTIEASGRSLLQAGAIRADGEGGNSGGGAITLAATGALIQTAAGEISANGSSQGGTIALSGGSAAFLSGAVSANGERGGRISVTAPQLTLAAATMSADGTTNGGTLLIGGDAHGDNSSIANAQTTIVNPYTTLSAQGHQGKIVVWSDQNTRYYGSAKTGADGFIEVSGKETLSYGGQADAGVGGHVLLDPTDLIIDNSAPTMFYIDLANPNPAASETHGSGGVVELANGNIVVASPNDNFGGSKAGAAYLYNGSNGALISTLTGSTANDQVGYGVTALPVNGNYVVASRNWDNGTIVDAGAATWGSGTAGVSGIVSSVNSLVGSKAGDQVSSTGIAALTNGNYVVRSHLWDYGTISDAGAVTWGNGTTGVSGVITSSNSLVGSTASDQVGSTGITVLTNGNYVVRSSGWDNGSIVDAGAATWGNGTSGVVGVVSSANSLVGSSTSDMVSLSGVTALVNGNYVVSSWYWDNGTASNAGAVTWCDGTVGISGVVSSTNSLVGSSTNDNVSFVTALSNSNYVVRSYLWDNGTIADAGAVTWGNGLGGTVGAVSSTNSLVGSKANDKVGTSVTALTNGNYVVGSYFWDNGTIADAGAATWGNGLGGTVGAVSSANSLVGSTASDYVGTNITALTNGNYVVGSANWDNGTIVDAGAVTWGSGTSGISGVISSTNSLVGSTKNDQVGGAGVTALTNGNYVVSSPYWSNGAATMAGAATWGNGTSGTSGVVSSTNSLVGSKAFDEVGMIVTALANGNYVVRSYAWYNGTISGAGAATWGDGATGISGIVSSSNSLVGSSANDWVGLSVTALANGNYVVASPNWDSGTITDVGAVTWGSGTSSVSGVVNSSNSLVGKTANDQLGSGGIVALANGNYVVKSPSYGQGTITNAGAVWLVADPSNLAALVNGSTGSTTLSPAALAGAALAGSTVTLQASHDITVNSAVSVAGKLNLVAGNDLTLNAGIKSTATGNALQLSGQRFINNAGAGALSAANGRWLVWSATPSNDTRGGLAYAFKQYNASYGVSTVLGSGNGFLYTVAPVASASLTGSVSKVYDATTSAKLSAANYTSSGAIDGDSIALNNPVNGTYDSKNVAASGKDVAVSGLSIAGASNGEAMVYGYQLAATSVNGAVGAITPASLAVTGVSANNKVYDATTAATLSGTASVAALGSDVVGVIGTGSGTFADKNVGTAKAVTVSGFGLSGADAGNYSVVQPTGLTANITAASLTVNGISASDKVYDATSIATLNGTASVAALGSDVVNVTGTGSGTFADKNVGTAKTVAVSGFGLSGADAGNYSVVQPTGVTANITAANLTVNGISASDKVYDATSAATLNGTASVAALGSDVVSVTGAGSGAFADKNVGTAKMVSVSGYSLNGADAGNYNVVQPTGLTANITAASLAVSGISAS